MPSFLIHSRFVLLLIHMLPSHSRICFCRDCWLGTIDSPLYSQWFMSCNNLCRLSNSLYFCFLQNLVNSCTKSQISSFSIFHCMDIEPSSKSCWSKWLILVVNLSFSKTSSGKCHCPGPLSTATLWQTVTKEFPILWPSKWPCQLWFWHKFATHFSLVALHLHFFGQQHHQQLLQLESRGF